MTDSNEKILSTEAEDDLLNDDHDPKEKAPTTDHQDPMYTMMQNVNKTLGTSRSRTSSGFIPATQTINPTLNGVNTVPGTK